MDTIHGVICCVLCLDQFILVFFNPYKMGYPELRALGSLLYILSSYLKGKNTRLVSILSSVSDYKLVKCQNVFILQIFFL